MTGRLVIVHYGELALKGRNRPFFERTLAGNIRLALGPALVGDVQRKPGRMVARLADAADESEVLRRLGRVPGISNFAIGLCVNSDLNSLKSASASLLRGVSYTTFAVDARRSDKRYPLTSTELNQELGAFMLQEFGGTVRLDDPELTLHVEILASEALVYPGRRRGVGGLPVGVSGRVMALLSGGIDSPVAAGLMQKRGAHVEFIHFHSFPYTSKASQEKVVDLARILCECQPESRLLLVPFADIQKELVAGAPAPLRVVLYRRYMGRLAERAATRVGARALVTGESLGQVASQTLENLVAIEEALAMPVLRPLVGMDKQEIVEIARRQGTYGVSIEPHDDCCSYLMPAHPATRATAEELRAAEGALDLEELMNAALDRAETFKVGG